MWALVGRQDSDKRIWCLVPSGSPVKTTFGGAERFIEVPTPSYMGWRQNNFKFWFSRGNQKANTGWRSRKRTLIRWDFRLIGLKPRDYPLRTGLSRFVEAIWWESSCHKIEKRIRKPSWYSWTVRHFFRIKEQHRSQNKTKNRLTLWYTYFLVQTVTHIALHTDW